MVYAGSGGPLPSEARKNGAIPYGQKPFGFHLSEALPNGKTKKVPQFRVDPNEKNVPLVILDEALPSAGPAPTVRIHKNFKFNGRFGHTLLCASHRATGCPIDIIFQRENKFNDNRLEPVKGVWRWVATGIKLKPFTFTKGKLAGKTVPYQRCLILVPEKCGPSGGVVYDDILAYREQFADDGGMRGKVFNVRRKDDKMSSTVGTMWTPAGSMTDEEMMEKFEAAAADYGLPVEQYIRPYDYEHILKVPADEDMLVAAKWIAGDQGINLDDLIGGTSSTAEATTAESPVSSTTDGAEEEIPF